MIDGIYLYKLINNIKDSLIGSRIEKIYHPKEKLLVFKIKGPKLKYNKLVICIDPNFCSMHLSSMNLDNPEQPTSFCMLLRKYLESGLIVDVQQLGYERVVSITIESYNELGDKTRKILYLELMGKYSNVILTENELIVDAIYKYPIGVNGFREILSRRKYVSPPLNEKLTLFDGDIEILKEKLINYSDKDLSLSSFLQKNLQGFSNKTMKLFLNSIGFEDYIIGDLDDQSMNSLLTKLREYRDSLFIPDEEIINNTDILFNDFYFNKEINLQKQRLLSIIKKQITKLEKKANIYKDKINQDKDSDVLRIKGEILSANLYRINSKLPYIDLENYYEPDMPTIRIELNEALSPSSNVKQYFKKYHKVKEGKKQSEALLCNVNDELDYYKSIDTSLTACNNLNDLQEISEELETLGLIPKKSKRKKSQNKPNYLKIELDNGDIILVGKNNKQNDFLTFKDANNKDLWFHRHDQPGAHVILKSLDSTEPDEESIRLAAWNAAFYGADANVDGILVDFTIKRNVKRHPSLKLGKATYTDYSTLLVKR